VLASGAAPEAYDALRRGERTGRPLGSAAFVEDLERRLGRPLAPQKPGRKPKAAGGTEK
jgi:putative transposase